MKVYILFLIIHLLSLSSPSSGIQWLALSRLSSIASVNPLNMCEKMKGSLIRKQIKFCKKNPNFMDSVRLGAARAVDECQHQFASRRWNCSTLENRVERRMNLFRQQLNPSSMEAAWKQAGSPGAANMSLNSFPLELPLSGSSGRPHIRSKRQGRKPLSKENNRTNGTAPPSPASSLLPGDIHKAPGSLDLSDLEDLLSKARNRAKGTGGKRKKKKKKGRGLKGALGPYPVVSPGTKEMAFVHAISSAGVAHALTRACSSGDLENCGCDRSLRGMSPKGFQWSGCSDNVDFGITFSRTFVDARDRRKSRKKPTRAQPLMNLHNNEAGRKLLERNMKIECKCHGVSGSCELKTCWRSIASFRIIGEILKEKFDNAHEVTQKKRRGRRMLLPRYHKFKPHTDTDLVYLKVSPDYCDFDVQKGSLGTRGRECNPDDTESAQGCNFMCCNRGFETRLEKRVERCKCKFHWCCYVECEECFREVKVSTCN